MDQNQGNRPARQKTLAVIDHPIRKKTQMKYFASSWEKSHNHQPFFSWGLKFNRCLLGIQYSKEETSRFLECVEGTNCVRKLNESIGGAPLDLLFVNEDWWMLEWLEAIWGSAITKLWSFQFMEKQEVSAELPPRTSRGQSLVCLGDCSTEDLGVLS